VNIKKMILLKLRTCLPVGRAGRDGPPALALRRINVDEIKSLLNCALQIPA